VKCGFLFEVIFMIDTVYSRLTGHSTRGYWARQRGIYTDKFFFCKLWKEYYWMVLVKQNQRFSIIHCSKHEFIVIRDTLANLATCIVCICIWYMYFTHTHTHTYLEISDFNPSLLFSNLFKSPPFPIQSVVTSAGVN